MHPVGYTDLRILRTHRLHQVRKLFLRRCVINVRHIRVACCFQQISGPPNQQVPLGAIIPGPVWIIRRQSEECWLPGTVGHLFPFIVIIKIRTGTCLLALRLIQYLISSGLGVPPVGDDGKIIMVTVLRVRGVFRNIIGHDGVDCCS
jgi:hypothetical protein